MNLAALLPALAMQALCIDMTHEDVGMTNTGCIEGDRMRIDARQRGEEAPQVSWIIDFASESSTFVLRDQQAFKRVALDAQVKALSPDLRKQLTAQTKASRGKAAAMKVAAVAGETTDDCGWYTMTSGQDVSQVCVKAFPSEIVREVQRAARLVRDVQRKHQPLSLDGVPLMNVELPLYAPKGLIGAGKLVTKLRTPRPNMSPLDMTFAYRNVALATDYFEVPAGFSESK